MASSTLLLAALGIAPGRAEAAPLDESDGGIPSAELAYFDMRTVENGRVQNVSPEGPDASLFNGGARVADSAWWESNDTNWSLQLDGMDDYTSAAVTVGTDRSFSVAAWVKLGATGRSETAVSQDAEQVSAFTLKADTDGTWYFGVPRMDSIGSVWDVARGPKATVGRWTHLAGVFDAPAGQLRLYVDGAKVASAGHSAPWGAAGELQLGRGKQADYLQGNLDEVHVRQDALSDGDVRALVVDPADARYDR